MSLIATFCLLWSWWARFRRLRILKSYGGRWGIWMGIGWQSQSTPFLTRSWLTTVMPPYLRGIGLNVSVLRFSVRGGWYRRLSDHGWSDEDVDTDGELKVLGWGSGEEVGDVVRSKEEPTTAAAVPR